MTAPNNKQNDTPAWHSLSNKQVLAELNSNAVGLTTIAAFERLQRFGPNKLRANHAPSPLWRFVSQFNNVLLYILMIAAVVTAFLGLVVDTAVILGVLIINACIGYLQEERAEKALQAIPAIVQDMGRKK